MPELTPKQEKLIQLKSLGLIDDDKDFDNLSIKQLDFLLKRVPEIKRTELTEEEIDKLSTSEKLSETTQQQLQNEIVKRRKSEQELKSYKSDLKKKLDDLSAMLK